MLKEYQSDPPRWVKVSCSMCAGSIKKSGETTGDSPAKKPERKCDYCSGKGTVTVEASDGSPRICTCGHCHGTGQNP